MNEQSPEDALDAALDRLPDGSSDAPDWLARVDDRLRSLDAAYARTDAGGPAFALTATDEPGAVPPVPLRPVGTFEPAMQQSRWRTLATAAVLLLMVAGALVYAGDPAWFDDRDSSDRDSIPAVLSVDPDEDRGSSAVIVRPSSCTFPPLTRERYDQAMAGKTPIPSDELDGYLATQDEAMALTLAPVVIGGQVMLTAGSPAPRETASEIKAVLSSYMACINQGDEARLNGFLSDEFMPWVSDPDAMFIRFKAVPRAPDPLLLSLQIEQLRLLEDGRVAAVVTFSLGEPSLPQHFNDAPDPTPVDTIAIPGHIMVFVETSEGWHLDYSRPGKVFRMPSGAGSPVAPAAVATEAPVVITPGHCIYSPTYRSQLELELRLRGINLSPTRQPVNEAGRTAAEEELRAYYVSLLDHEVRDGDVVFTVGQPANAGTVQAIAHRLETLFGCLTDGKNSAILQFISRDFLLRLLPNIEWPVDGTPIPEDQAGLLRFEISQARLLPDGRVMVVYTSLMEPEDMVEGFGFSPMPTPANTTEPTGPILIFIFSGGTWQLDFQIGPDAFRMPLHTEAATPSAANP